MKSIDNKMYLIFQRPIRNSFEFQQKSHVGCPKVLKYKQRNSTDSLKMSLTQLNPITAILDVFKVAAHSDEDIKRSRLSDDILHYSVRVLEIWFLFSEKFCAVRICLEISVEISSHARETRVLCASSHFTRLKT